MTIRLLSFFFSLAVKPLMKKFKVFFQFHSEISGVAGESGPGLHRANLIERKQRHEVTGPQIARD